MIMSTPSRIVGPPAALLTVALLALPSCSNSMRFDFMPRFDFDFNLEEAMKELYPDEEMLFIQWCSETLEEDAKHNEFLKAPNIFRLHQAQFTYPDNRFPANMPDGVWRTDISNYGVPDQRFIRKAVGKEVRSNTDTSVRVVNLFARHRSDKTKRLVGGLFALGETVQEGRDRVEHQLFSVRIVGAYDFDEKSWTLVSKSIERVGPRR